jgi:hypothetical protein
MTGGQIAVLVFVLGMPVWAIVATVIAWKRSARVKASEEKATGLEQRYSSIVSEEAEVERLKLVAN